MKDMNDYDKNYTREEYIYMAKVYRKCNLYPEMYDAIKKFVIMNPKLSNDEISILLSGYKNIIKDKRESLKRLKKLAKKIKDTNKLELDNVKEIRDIIKKELIKIYNEILETIDKYLMINAQNVESKVLYLKLKGDFNRYLSGILSNEKEKNRALVLSEKFYKEGYALSEREKIPISSVTRLGLALNFSIFYCVDKGSKENALNIASKTYEEAKNIISKLDQKKDKDAIKIIDNLRENITCWNP